MAPVPLFAACLLLTCCSTTTAASPPRGAEGSGPPIAPAPVAAPAQASAPAAVPAPASAPAPAAAPRSATQGAPRIDPVARIHDRALTRAEFGEWLVDRSGVSVLYDFVAEQVILTEAAQRGLSPSQADLDRAYETEKAHVVDAAYGGDVAQWEEDQVRRGYTLESAKARRQHEMAPEVALAAMIRADRDVSEQRIQERFHELYGDPPERVSVEMLRFNAYRDLVPGERPDIPALKKKAVERAQTVRAAWVGGTPLAELLVKSDDPGNPLVVQGVVAEFRSRVFGKEIDAAVHSLDKPGDVSLPIEVFDGAWLVRLVRREPVTVDQVREAIVAEMRAAPVDSAEINTARNALMERYKPDMLLK